MAVSAAAQEVHVDYDRSGRFSWYKTFAWYDSEETSLEGHNDLMHSRIKNAIEHHLSQGRLKEATDDPDLYVTYHAGSREEVRVNTAHLGYGFPGSWSWDPYWFGPGGTGTSVSTTTVSKYTAGTLIIDIWDAREKKLVWRGTAIDILFDSPQQADKKIDKAIEKMIKKWRKMKPGL
jgi:hypothetical protein